MPANILFNTVTERCVFAATLTGIRQTPSFCGRGGLLQKGGIYRTSITVGKKASYGHLIGLKNYLHREETDLTSWKGGYHAFGDYFL